MKYPEVKHCCCGCSLETGSQVIGWLQMILIPLVNMLDISFDYSIPGDDETPSAGPNPTVLMIYHIESLIASIGTYLGFFVSILLVVGVRRKKSVILDFWVKYKTVVMIINTIIIIVSTPFLWSYGMRSLKPFIGLIGIFISIVIDFYCIVVVSSCRKKMSRSPTPQDPEIQFAEIPLSKNDCAENQNNANDTDLPKDDERHL